MATHNSDGFPLQAAAHLLQQTLRSLCLHENSHWIYAVLWRILPRNYPPPKWDAQGEMHDRSRGNKRNWILVWEDGFCNFLASATNTRDELSNSFDEQSPFLSPDLFFKMSHEVYCYGEGLIGKVAADKSHQWIVRESSDNEANPLSPWQSFIDPHPRTWEAQFQSGVQTIALISVAEGVLQLGSVKKVKEDLNYIGHLKTRFTYLQSIPGVLFPHPSSASLPIKNDGRDDENRIIATTLRDQLLLLSSVGPNPESDSTRQRGFINYFETPMCWANLQEEEHIIAPSMSSLETLLSKLPSVKPNGSSELAQFYKEC